MKRSNQSKLESAVVASLIIALTLGGTLGGLSLPSVWENLPNPANIQTQFNYANFALLYNMTLTELADQNFTGVSYLIESIFILELSNQIEYDRGSCQHRDRWNEQRSTASPDLSEFGSESDCERSDR